MGAGHPGQGAGTGMDGHVLGLKAWNETLRTGGDQEVGESQMKPRVGSGTPGTGTGIFCPFDCVAQSGPSRPPRGRLRLE